MTKASDMSYIPPGLFHGLLSVSSGKNISFAEVHNTVIRYFLDVRFNIRCEHPEEFIFTNRQHKTYCKRCWTRMRVLRKRGKGYENGMGRWHEGEPGKYEPMMSDFEKELRGTALLGLSQGGE